MKRLIPLSGLAVWKDRLVITNVSGEVILLDKKTHKEIERKPLGHSNSAVFSSLEVEEDYLAVFSSRNPFRSVYIGLKILVGD